MTSCATSASARRSRAACARSSACAAHARQRRLLRRLPDDARCRTPAPAPRSRPTPPPGKLNAEITPHTPSGCQVSIIRWSGRSEAMVSPCSCRERPDGEVADVDHLLHFAQAFLQELAGLERHQHAERVLVRAQRVAEAAHQLAAARRRHGSPASLRGSARAMAASQAAGAVVGTWRQQRPVDRRTGDPAAAMRAGSSSSCRRRGVGEERLGTMPQRSGPFKRETRGVPSGSATWHSVKIRAVQPPQGAASSRA